MINKYLGSILNVEFRFSTLENEYIFEIDTKDNVTYIEGNTLKVVGETDLVGIDTLTKWYQKSCKNSNISNQLDHRYQPEPYTVTAHLPKGKVIRGCYPISMNFQTTEVENKWIVFMVIEFDIISKIKAFK